jgi:hypothetical protein
MLPTIADDVASDASRSHDFPGRTARQKRMSPSPSNFGPDESIFLVIVKRIHICDQVF